MKKRVRIIESLTTSEHLELEQAETRGFLVAPESSRAEFLSEYLERRARNSRNAILLQIRDGKSPQIVIQACCPKDYFEFRKLFEARGTIEVANPFSGLVVVAVEASTAEAIARDLAIAGARTCVADLPSDLSNVSVEVLAEWLLCLPMSLENAALLQLLEAGKVYGEREVHDGQATMVFRSSGAIGGVSAFLRKWPGVEVGIIELFTRGTFEFRIGISRGKPTILWHRNSKLADTAPRAAEFSH